MRDMRELWSDGNHHSCLATHYAQVPKHCPPLILAISVQIQELENDPTSSRRAQYLANRYLAQAKTSGVGLRHRTVRHKIAVSHQNPVKRA
ncbi:Uncharacterised protein [Vibrio cholerae]|nr:Uncharacterised protein [Vibrio cholerae]CSB71280.1 Uncharacterised protein [Vibrio cholerae]